MNKLRQDFSYKEKTFAELYPSYQENIWYTIKKYYTLNKTRNLLK